jgi:dipeptidyl aminopeptidase/acylaminoacyl peptidase
MENERLFFEEDVKFAVGTKELNGILTHPAKEGPHPAIVLLHGADRSSAADPGAVKCC